MQKSKRPRYKDLDPNIDALVKALNAFPGITTIGSCGGHENPTLAQAPAGSWWVKMEIARDDDGHFALEFLAWLINHGGRCAGSRVILLPDAPPPYVNFPGRVLTYLLEGEGEDPDELAAWINKCRRELYVDPEAAAAWKIDDEAEAAGEDAFGQGGLP